MMDRRTHRQRSQRGFTLAEILVTTAIFAIIMIAALAVYDKSNQVFKQSTEAADLQQSTRIGFDKLVADLRMAGFDYNRGGIPSGSGQFTQPDEQIEYAGVAAVAFRGNFDYNSDAARGNGLEDNPAGGEDYTPKDVDGKPIFPYVTTGNDEIIIYVLRSNDNTKNTSSLSFWVDKDAPRTAYPGSRANGREGMVTVTGIDTTNANPPYTLYRMTVADAVANPQRQGTPVAENIRALQFFYYTDLTGSTALGDPPPVGQQVPTPIVNGRNADGSTFPATVTINAATVSTGAIGGAGQYDAGNVGGTANFQDRSQRTLITSVRVSLAGMNAQEDGAYTHPTETITNIKRYRQYSLQALVVPRNLGLTGFPEPSFNPPGQPTITGLCTGHCAAPYICWTPPTVGGPVYKYTIEWDLNPNGSFAGHSLDIFDPSATYATLPDDGSIDPSKTWYYRIRAINDNGSSPPIVPAGWNVVPRNSTKPLPPRDLRATAFTAPNSSDPSAIDNTVRLNWTAASQNDPVTANLTCIGSNCNASGASIPTQEIIRYQVWRGTDPAFQVPAQAVPVLQFGMTQPASAGPGSPMTWDDAALTSAYPPGTCVDYYYRIMAADRCASNPAYNTSGNISGSISVSSPDDTANEPAVRGRAYDAGVKASAPPTLSINGTSSACPQAPGPNCRVVLNWLKVTTDTSGNAVGVDKYRIVRYHKKMTDIGFILDSTFDAANGRPYIDVGGFSQTAPGTATYTDTSGIAIDPGDGRPWFYRYTVQANDCSGGIASAPADYPTTCSVNPTITAPGAQNPSSTADAPLQAWILGAGDTITVGPPGSVTVRDVTFEITTYPGGVAVGSPIVVLAPGAYVFPWPAAMIDLQVYQIKITVNLTNLCSEVHVKYVQDQQAAPCSFANLPVAAFGSATGGTTTTLTETYTLTNSGADPMQLAGLPINTTWAIDPADTNHPDMKMTAIAYQVGTSGFSTSENFTGIGPGTVTRTMPTAVAGMPDLATSGANASLTITVRWQYRKQDDPPAPLQPLRKICLDYTIASEPGVTKHCNLVGQAAPTNNPTACD